MANKLKHCSRCSRDKIASKEFFWRNVKRKDGFNDWCKECANSYRASLHKQDRNGIDLHFKGNTSLLVLNRLSVSGRTKINLSVAKRILKAYVEAKTNCVKIDLDYVKKSDIPISLGKFSQFVSELKKAAKANYTLEKYLSLGRPFAISGSKVLIPEAKK